MQKERKIVASAVLSLCVSISALMAQSELRNATLSEICYINYRANTQDEEMGGSLSVCWLESERGTDTSLYIARAFEKTYPVDIDRILPGAHSPLMKRDGDEIVILYTSGVNTTCVTIYSIDSGVAEFQSTEAIAWNDGGVYRKSENFQQFESLVNERERITKRSTGNQ